MLKKYSQLSHVVLASVLSVSAYATTPIKLAEIATKNPAFLSIEQSGESEKPLLMISSFTVNLFSKDEHSVSYLNNIADVAEGAPAQFSEVNTSLVWPNQAQYVQNMPFNQNGVLVANGFFDVIPFKNNSTGSISFISMPDKKVHRLTTDKKGYYYHKAVWLDLYGDGNYGYLTARTNKTPNNKNAVAELVWLTPNDNNYQSFPWHEEVLVNGPDVHFEVVDLDHDGKPEIIASEFFNEKLTVLWHANGKWERREIASDIGPIFDVQVASLQGDAQQSLLVTNHTNDEKLAGVYAYEIPADYQTGTFVRHALWTGIKTTKGGPGQASPGKAIPFRIVKGQAGKPAILVAGDGAENATVLTPKSQDVTDWDYDVTEIFKSSHDSVVGQPAISYSKSGKAQLFIPEYDNNRIHFYQY